MSRYTDIPYLQTILFKISNTLPPLFLIGSPAHVLVNFIHSFTASIHGQAVEIAQASSPCIPGLQEEVNKDREIGLLFVVKMMIASWFLILIDAGCLIAVVAE